MVTYPENWAGKSIGTILREEREARGISLDEAARVTRIGKNYLVALESDLHDKLPNPAYIKGFMRIYSGYLGLSGDQVIACYEQASAVQPPPAAEKASPAPSQGEPVHFRGKGRWYLSLLLLGLVVVVSFFFGERDERPKPPPPIATVPQPSPAVPVQKPVTSSVTAVAPSEPAADGAGDQAGAGAGTPRQKGVILRLKVNQDSRLTITIDSSFSQQYDLKAGDLIEWKGERMFTLDLSNGGGVEAELNGKTLPSFGATGKPAHVVLKDEEREKATDSSYSVPAR